MPELKAAGQAWSVTPGSNLLDALNGAGLRVPYSCRSGSCHACLVRCVRGAIYDVIVDIEPDSPTYRRWVGVMLAPGQPRMLYVPTTCAHGFQTLADDTEVNYLVSEPYVATAGRGLRYDDPALAISWPLPVSHISPQDRSWPLLDPAPARAA